MKAFPSTEIRNVALVGHGNSGKTSIAEALLFVTGATKRLGRVEDGTTVCDFDPEEVKRQISVSMAIAPFEHLGHKINLLDTPGYVDFLGDAATALRIADLAVFVISGVQGVEVHTETLWAMAEAQNLPRMFFVNKLDRERSSFERVLADLESHFGAGVAPVQLPIGEEDGFHGVADLLTDRAYLYEGSPTTGVTPAVGTIPTELEAREHAVHDSLVEGIVVADDVLMERYLAEEPIPPNELERALAKGIAEGSVFPTLCGSATTLIGIDRLANFIAEESPAPTTLEGRVAAVAFKTIADPYVGRVNLLKVFGGTLHPDTVLINTRTGHDEKLHHLSTMRGKEQEPALEIPAGDIVAVAKLLGTRTGDLLIAHNGAVNTATHRSLAPFELMTPNLPVAIRPSAKGDDDKLATALHRLEDEDPSIKVERNPETRQTLLWGMGETHLSIAIEHLSQRFGVRVERDEVRVAYRETITAPAEAEGRYKKQTGGHGQFGVVSLRVEPLERGGGFEFVDAVVGGAIPRQFIPAVEKGVLETIAQAGVLGFPVVDVKVTCLDGKHHPVDSSEMSFKMAASLGLREALAKGSPVLLEPMSEVVCTVPESSQGDVLGDLNAKRGRIQGTASVGVGVQEIMAIVPTAEILRYAVDLRSFTAGRGRFTAQHSHYDPAPPHVIEKLRSTYEPT